MLGILCIIMPLYSHITIKFLQSESNSSKLMKLRKSDRRKAFIPAWHQGLCSHYIGLVEMSEDISHACTVNVFMSKAWLKWQISSQLC